MPQELELKPVSRITAGVVGTPGKRVFYLQARKDDQLVTLIVEKQQIISLAVGVETFFEDLYKKLPELPQAAPDYDERSMSLEEPLDPIFRVGQIGLGYDESSDLVVLVAREVQDEGADPEQASVVRLWCTRPEMRALCQWGLQLASRGRPVCGNCGQPIDAEGHFCPKRNGHKH